MNNLATALASFKNHYGDFPPSRVILAEGGYTQLLATLGAAANTTMGDSSLTTYFPNETPLADTNCTDMTVSQLIQRSRLYIRRFWPRVDFDNSTIGLDFNGDGATNGTSHPLGVRMPGLLPRRATDQ